MPGQKKTPTIASTQKYLNLLAIREGMIILRDGGIRTVLEVGSLNFALKSEEEQNGMLYQYQQFLNSLKFPIQIVMQSRRLDLYTYLKKLRELLDKQTNDLIRIQTEEYINYVEKLLTRANIMDKKFYIVVPYFPSGIERTSMIDKVLGAGKTGDVHFTKDQFSEYKVKLDERVNVISGGLGGMGLKVSPLDTQQMIELLYSIYNPAEAMSERMTDVNNLESPVVKSDIPSADQSAGATDNEQGPADQTDSQVNGKTSSDNVLQATVSMPVPEQVTATEGTISTPGQVTVDQEIYATPQAIQGDLASTDQAVIEAPVIPPVNLENVNIDQVPNTQVPIPSIEENVKNQSTQ